MSISKISFMAESALLNKSQSSIQSNSVAQADGVKTESKADTAEKVQAETTQSESATQESSHSNAKAWGIGLSAAAVLMTLGVLAGRKGYLGESAQKLLGGLKKENGNLNPRTNDLLDGVELPSGNNTPSKPDITFIEPEEVVTTGTQSGVKWHIEEPEVAKPITSSGENNVADNVADAIREKAPETHPTTPPATPSAASKGEAQVLKAEDIDVDKINASLNRTLPKLDYPMQVEVPETKALLEESKYVLDSLKASESGFQILPNGNECVFRLDSEGKVCAYEVYDRQGALTHNFYRLGNKFVIYKEGCSMTFLSTDKSLLSFSRGVDDNYHLNYDKNGFLKSIYEYSEISAGYKRLRSFEPQGDNGLVVTYFNPSGNTAIKKEFFQDGKLETELFLDDWKVIKEIDHEIK